MYMGRVALYPFADDSQLGFVVNGSNHRWNISATRITARYGIWLVDGSGNYDPVICKSAFNSAISSISS